LSGCFTVLHLLFLLIYTGKHEPASVTTVDLTEEEAAKPPLPSLPQDAEVKDTPSLPTGKSEITNVLSFVVSPS